MKSNDLYNYSSQNGSFRIDLNYAQEFGSLLKNIREGKGLSLHDVANALVLSDRQIQCLETGGVNAFYGLIIFVTALNKYADFFGVKPNKDMLVLEGAPLAGTIPNCPATVEPSTSAAAESTIATSSNVRLKINPKRNCFKTKTSPNWVVRLAIAMIAIVALMNYTPISSWFSQRYVVAEPQIENPKKSPASRTESAPKIRHDQNEIVMSFDGKSWVQIVFLDGRVIEKTYNNSDTESFNLDRLKSLTIGNTRVTSLTFNGKSLNPEILKTKTKASVMKLTGEDIRSSSSLNE